MATKEKDQHKNNSTHNTKKKIKTEQHKSLQVGSLEIIPKLLILYNQVMIETFKFELLRKLTKSIHVNGVNLMKCDTCSIYILIMLH